VAINYPRNQRNLRQKTVFICAICGPFYAKQTQFVEAENALFFCTTKCYTKSTFLSKAKNKPNSNPIKPNFWLS